MAKITEHIRIKNKVREIVTKQQLLELFDLLAISETDKQILELIYIENKTVDYIADILGYSPKTVKIKHKKLLLKLAKLL